MRFTAAALARARRPAERIYVSLERNMQCGVGHCGHCQLGPTLICRDGPVYRYDELDAVPGGAGSCERGGEAEARRLEVRVVRRLPALACSTARTSCSRSPARSRSPTSSRRRARRSKGPYDLSLVEGSITTAARRRADPARSARASTALVTIGACATAGGDPGAAQLRRRRRVRLGRLRHARVHLDARDLDADLRARAGRLRAARLPDQQAPAARGDHGVPARPPPEHPDHSVCIECKRRGTVCVMVAHGTPCLGPVTHAGCGALCPAYDRGCYGCFGPMETPNTAALTRAAARASAWTRTGVDRVFRTFNVRAAFEEARAR